MICSRKNLFSNSSERSFEPVLHPHVPSCSYLVLQLASPTPLHEQWHSIWPTVHSFPIEHIIHLDAGRVHISRKLAKPGSRWCINWCCKTQILLPLLSIHASTLYVSFCAFEYRHNNLLIHIYTPDSADMETMRRCLAFIQVDHSPQGGPTHMMPTWSVV